LLGWVFFSSRPAADFGADEGEAGHAKRGGLENFWKKKVGSDSNRSVDIAAGKKVKKINR